MIKNKTIGEESSKDLVRIAGETVIGTPSGLKAQHAQAELTKRLTDSINRLNSSTTFYSDRMLELTIFLFVLGSIQIVISLRSVVSTTLQWAFGSVLFLFFLYRLVQEIIGGKRNKL
jgi:hypothetical protein